MIVKERTGLMPKKIGPLCIYSWGWDLKLPFGYWLTFINSRPAEGGHCTISLDGTPNTGIFHFRIPWL